MHKTGVDRVALNIWWIGRSIPASRMGIDDVLRSLGVSAPALLVEKSLGLCLSDQYWICPKNSGLCWADVNFFSNSFSTDMGEALFGNEPATPDKVDFTSPDNTTEGWLRKKWIIADGMRLLMKSGSGVYQQEPFNEVIASVVMRRLEVEHIPYTLTFINGEPYSLCENFITSDTELITAWRVIQTKKQPSNRSLRDHFYDCCDILGAQNVRDSMNKMLTVDYIISNEDRHLNNFGLIRNAETLEWYGLAPVYDSGTSLWYNMNTRRVGATVESKPFRRTHAEQIKLVDDLSWYDFEQFSGLGEEIMEVMSGSEAIDVERRLSITFAVVERCEQIDRLAGV